MARPQVYWPRPVRVDAGEDGVPLTVAGAAVEAVREDWLVEDRWWTPKPCKDAISSWCLPTAATWSSSVSRPRAGPGSSSGHRWASPVQSSCTPTAYSFLDGVSLPEEMAVAAAEHGYEAFALTDHDNVCGAMEFAQACDGLGVRPIAGAELTVVDDGGDADRSPFHLTLLVEDATSLAQPLPPADRGPRRDAAPARSRPLPLLPLEVLLERTRAGLSLRGARGRRRRERGSRRMPAGRRGATAGRASDARRFLIELQRLLWRRDRARNRRLAELADLIGVATVATGNVHAHNRRGQSSRTFVAVGPYRARGSEPERRGNRARCSLPAEMATRFADHPGAVAQTARLAERLCFDVRHELGYRYPARRTPRPT